MNTIKATVRNGRIETDSPIDLPDGTVLLLSLPESDSPGDEDSDDSPETIAEWLDWYNGLEPLIFSDDELAVEP
jgi:hypothetical protein